MSVLRLAYVVVEEVLQGVVHLLQSQLLGQRVGAGGGVVYGELLDMVMPFVLLLRVVPRLLPVAFTATVLLDEGGERVGPLTLDDELFLGAEFARSLLCAVLCRCHARRRGQKREQDQG